MYWQTSRFLIDLSRPQIMGIVNITPDSFSDGGRWSDTGMAMAHCEKLLAQGADILDLGAESSRPGASPVPVQVELERLMPVLAHALTLGVPVSVDTYKPEVMRAALDVGADILNDIWGLRQPATTECPGAMQVVARHPSCGVCLMHMHRNPQTMQISPMTGDVVQEVYRFLERQCESLQKLDVQQNRILVDPGIGFGKTSTQNLLLLARQQELVSLGAGLLAGWSRKSTLGVVITGIAGADNYAPAQDRLIPSVVAALLAVQNGASVVRVHDVRETVHALQMWQAVSSAAQ
jgi:dihydropteroate synthase